MWQQSDGNGRARGLRRSAVASLLAGGMALAAVAWPVAWLPVCPFHRLTGIPCPTCGATRCVKALLHGDWAMAIQLQPLIVAIVMAAAMWLAYAWGMAVFGWPYPVAAANRREKWLLGISAAALVLANWAYLVVRGV